jgi:hypothetical protein
MAKLKLRQRQKQGRKSWPRSTFFLQNAREYPYLISYKGDGGEVIFTYNERLDDTKLVFSVSANDAEADQFLVKFVRRYSKDAHRHPASLGFAPRLRQFATIPGGWSTVMIVHLFVPAFG